MKKKHLTVAGPPEVQIYCNGQQAFAYFNGVEGIWKCARCGAKVKVAW